MSWTIRILFAAALAAGVASAATPGGPAPAGPRIVFTDVDAGPTRGGPDGLGVPITIFGTGFGRERGDSRVTIGGREVARYVSWGTQAAANPRLQTVVVQPGPTTGGTVQISVGGRTARAPTAFAPTRGRVLLVAGAGSDRASCSMRAPCATITRALHRMRPGDVVLVRGSTVADDEVWAGPKYGGRPGRPISILAYPGDRPVFTRTGRPVILEGSHIRFAGFSFPDGKSLEVGADSADDIWAVDNTFAGEVAFDAVGTHGDDLLIAGNVCHASGSSQGTQGHCFYISKGRRIEIIANVATGATGYGLHVFDEQRSADDGQRVIADVLIEDNVLSSSLERSGLIVEMDDQGHQGNLVTGVTIRDNLFTGNNFAGIAIGANVRNVLIAHNTFVGNGRQGITIYDDPTIDGVTIRGNLLDQSSNDACHSNCSWYRELQIEVGAGARRVSVSGNWYAPGAPLIAGTRDASARHGKVAYGTSAAGDPAVVSPAGATGYGWTRLAGG